MLLVLVLAAAWGALLWSQALAAVQRSAATERRLRAQLTLARDAAMLRHPPDIGLLCLASPLTPFRTRKTDAEGTALEIRWRHLGGGIILGEFDLRQPTGDQMRVVAWLTPDSVAEGEGGLRCRGRGLRALASPSVVVRPGE